MARSKKNYNLKTKNDLPNQGNSAAKTSGIIPRTQKPAPPVPGRVQKAKRSQTGGKGKR